MKLNEKLLYNPKCFDMLISSTGLLSGRQRKERIIEIGKKNIWLAAKCKNTCVNDEQEIVDWILIRANVVYSQFHDVHAIAALMELREYGALCVLLGILTNYKKHNSVPKGIHKLLVENERSISKVFAVFSEYIDKELTLSIFSCLSDLGYVLESDAYNAIIAKSDNQDEINNFLNRMRLSGIESNLTTYYNLLQKAITFEEAKAYFEKIKNLDNYGTHVKLLKECYKCYLHKAWNYEDIEQIKKDYLKVFADDFFGIAFDYYSQTIQVSRTFVETKLYHEALKSYFISQINKYKTLSNKKKKIQLTIVINSIINRVKVESSHYEEIVDILLWYVMVCSEMGNLQINVRERVNLYYLILNILKELKNFQKCKKLIDYMIKNQLWAKHPSFDDLFQYVQNKDDITYLLGYKNILLFKPQSIVRTILSCDDNLIGYIIKVFDDNKYPLNLIHYNAIIKRVSLEKSFFIIHNMRMNGIVPDKYTIHPLLHKWENINELLTIIQLAISLSIDADKYSAPAIAKQIIRTNMLKQFVDFADDLLIKEKSFVNSSWRNAIIEVINYLLIKV